MTMRYTIMSLFVDMESDADYTSFDRGPHENGYSLDDAVTRIMHRALAVCHSEATMRVAGAHNAEGVFEFRVSVIDDHSSQRWSLCGE